MCVCVCYYLPRDLLCWEVKLPPPSLKRTQYHGCVPMQCGEWLRVGRMTYAVREAQSDTYNKFRDPHIDMWFPYGKQSFSLLTAACFCSFIYSSAAHITSLNKWLTGGLYGGGVLLVMAEPLSVWLSPQLTSRLLQVTSVWIKFVPLHINIRQSNAAHNTSDWCNWTSTDSWCIMVQLKTGLGKLWCLIMSITLNYILRSYHGIELIIEDRKMTQISKNK